MNRYLGNSVVERIPEPSDAVATAPVYFGGAPANAPERSRESAPPPQSAADTRTEDKKPPGSPLTGGALGGLLSKLGDKIGKPELEDIMLIAFMYLLYRETGDTEFLLMGGALLLG